MLVVDKPPITGAPPILPPFLTPDKRPERRIIILPDLCRIESQQVLKDFTHNWQTCISQWMMRITNGSVLEGSGTWEFAHTHTRRYRQWLETYETPDGIPPHIQFGGAIEAGERDTTFYPRWCAWAKETFC
jgi:hypothetical protein